MKNYFYSKVFLVFGLMVTLAGGISFNPRLAEAIATCSAAGTPTITVNIGGTNYSNNASVSVASGSTVAFTVYTRAEPNSSNTISYPGGSNSYASPSSTGRSYTTSAINSTGQINVGIQQNCQPDPDIGQANSITITLNTVIAGACSSPAAHYTCASGTSANNVNGASAYTWNCNGSNGGTNASCSEAKSSYTVTATATPSTGGNPTQTQSVPYNTPAQIQVNTNSPDYTVDTGLVRGCPLPSTGNGFSSNNTIYTTGLVTGNCNAAFTFTAVPPSTPTNLRATQSSCGTGTIDISWSASSGATSYTLKDGSTTIYTGAGTSFSHTGLTAGSSHSYTVSATNANNGTTSSPSGAVSANAPAACTATTLPDLTASVSSTTATTNVAQNFSAAIVNNGSVAASGTVTHLFEFDENSDHTSITGSSTSNTTSSIPSGGGSRNITSPYTFTTAGTKYIRVCADADSRGPSNTGSTGTVTETIESNNCSNWATVTVTDVPSTTVNGICSTAHYNCTAGTSASNAEVSPNWTWMCNGSGGGTNASCSETIPKPTSFISSCAANGTSASFSWILPSGYTMSYFRINDSTTGVYLSQYSIPESVSDTGPSTSLLTTPGHSYTAWVHTRLQSGGYSDPVYSTFGCAGATVMSGTLTVPDCTIASGGNSCNSTSNWSITNPQTVPTDITASGMTNIHVSNSLTPNPQSGTQSVSVPYPTRTFYLFNKGQSLAQATASATCAAGTSWNGTMCSPVTVLWGDLAGPSSCTIASGASTCNVSMNWYITNPQTVPTDITASGMTNIHVSNSLTPNPQSGTQSVSVPYNSRVFYLYNNGILLDSQRVTSSCASGTGWNGSKCSSTTGTKKDGSWSGWSACSASCGPGVQTRTCTPPQNGGLPCGAVDGGNATQSCNIKACTGEVVNGVCSSSHYTCSVGTSLSNVSGASAWTWTCQGSGGGNPASCSELKKKPIFTED